MRMAIVYDPEKHCGAHSRRGKVCTNGKGAGTNHPGYRSCKYHGGAAPGSVKAAQRDMAQAALTELGRPIDKDPQRALLEQVYEAAGNVEFLRVQVQALGAHLVMDTRQGGQMPVGLVDLYNQERDRLAKIAKMAIDAGIAERFVRLAEDQAAAIVRVIDAVLDGLELSDEQRDRGREIAGAQLRLVS